MTDTKAPYRAFTTTHDKIIHAREIMANLPQDIREQIEARMDLWSPDSANAAPADGAHPVRFLLDMSGSMRGAPFLTLLSAMRTEGDRLDAAGVPFEILGFTTSSWRGGQSRKDWNDAGRPSNPGRLSDLLHVIIKGMEEDWSECRNLLGVYLKDGALKENVDGEAVEWAMSRAAHDTTPTALVMVSDGFPHCDSTLSVNPIGFLENHLDEVLDRAIEEGVAFQRIRMGHDWHKNGDTLRDDVDIPVLGSEVGFWAQCMREALDDTAQSEAPVPRLRMGVGEDVPMNPLNHALADAVTKASLGLTKMIENQSSFSI